MGRGKKQELSKEEIRQRVDQVMDQWQSYPDFAQLFEALLDANGLTLQEFADQYTEATGNRLSLDSTHRIRYGDFRPSHQFVADIADHDLLSCGPDRMRAASDSLPAGDRRIVLFTAAGLIEVTPDSIRKWNEEVLAGWQRGLERRGVAAPLTWKELAKKLLSFQFQGEYRVAKQIAETANRLAGPECQLVDQRLRHMISAASIPSRAERLGIARAIELNPSQIELIESAVENGTLPISPRPTRSRMMDLLGEILDRLKTHGISQRQLALRTILPGGAEPQVVQTTISSWKTGTSEPTQAALRALVKALETCFDASGRLVSDDDIRQVVDAAGFSLEELAATTHDIVACIDQMTRIKPLLKALRNAPDLNVAMPEIDSPEAQPENSTEIVRLSHRLAKWEIEDSVHFPTESDVSEILVRYNRLLLAKGEMQLTAEEIAKIVEVARRDRESGLEQGLRNRARERRPPSARRPISPEFDMG